MTESIETERRTSDGAAILAWMAATGLGATLLIAGLDQVSRRLPGERLEAPAGAATSGTPTAGQAGAVDFRLATLDGRQLGPADFPGKIVLLEFWATWCGPCRFQAQELEKLLEKPGMEDVAVLAVNVGEDAATVRAFAESSPFPYPVVLDPQETIGRQYGIMGLPTLMLLNEQREIAFRRTGVSPASTLIEQIRRLRPS